jgi:uncharacterized protein (DUF433 family)
VSNRPVSLRIPEEIRAAIEETARRTKRDFSSIANEMLEEAVRTRRIPGIVFADEFRGRVPTVAGTGLEPWEILRSYREADNDWERLKETYHWLSDLQLRAAIAYFQAYPEEIEARLKDEEKWTPEELWTQYPFTRPPWR